MLPRTLEPEVMDTPEEAVDYDAMDHRAVNVCFVGDFLSLFGCAAVNGAARRMLDVGTGTAQIPIELCGRSKGTQVVGVDLSEEMLKLGRANVAGAGCDAQIQLEHVDAKALPYADAAFDAVISNSIVHHIPEPRDAIAEMLRVLTPGGALFVRDLMRPSSTEEVERLVTTYAGGETAPQRKMFRESLHAALTVEEVAAILQELGCDWAKVESTSDRHWTVRGRRPLRQQ